MIPFPNLFVIGAMKSATTSLCDYLGQHPDIYMALEKEPFYFVEGQDQVAAENLPIRPDRGMVPGLMGSGEFATRAAYLSLFAPGADHRYRAEGSPLYLPDPGAAARIHAHAPDAKLIAVLRNPIDRAYSAYTFQRSFNKEPAPTFAQALQEELEGKRDTWWYGWRYIYTGRYTEQLRRYQDMFGAETLLVLQQDKMRTAPEAFCRKVFEFLDIDPSVQIDLSHSSNVTRMRSQFVTEAYRRFYADNPLKHQLKRVLPMSLRKAGNRAVRKTLESLGTRPEPIRPEDRALLADIFRPDIKDLENLLEWDLSAWQ